MNAEPPRRSMPRRYRRRILGWGAAGLVAVFVVGSFVTLARVESDLEGRVDAAALAAGVEGVAASFSGQSGTLECIDGAEVSDVELTSLRSLRGVRTLELGPGCVRVPSNGISTDIGTDAGTSTEGGSSEPEVPSGSEPDGSAVDTSDVAPDVTEPAPSGTDVVAESVADLVDNDSDFSTLSDLVSEAGIRETLAGSDPITLFAPTNAAFEELGPDTIAALGREPDVLVEVLLHHVTDGALGSSDLVDGELEMLDGSTVTIAGSGTGDGSGLTVVSRESEATVVGDAVEGSNGIVHGVDRVLVPDVVLPRAVPTTTTTSVAATTEATAAELEAALNDQVAGEPILFEPGRASIAPASAGLLGRLAGLISQVDGVAIEVRGHTDTDGDPVRNQALSEERAAAVRAALIGLDVDAGVLTSAGFGGTRVVVDAAGVEDKAASRRVDFVVRTT